MLPEGEAESAVSGREGQVMQRSEVDGVPVVWQEAPGPLRAALMFRVGRRDETFTTGGISHLVEHLVMGSLSRSHLDRNASVEIGTTTFTATGRPEQVADFLTSVCTALDDLPTARLATEAAVLRAESSAAIHPLVAHLLARRYGASSVGLAGFEEPTLRSLTAEQVTAFARRHFVRDNAVLTLTGPPPEGLRLPLPDGVRPDRAAAEPLPIAFPCWSEHPFDGVALGFVGPDSEAFAAGLRILRERLEDDLRHARGLVYEVDFFAGLVGPDTVHVGFVLDPRPHDTATVAREVVPAVRRLAADGPTADELAHDLEGLETAVADERMLPEHLDAHAADLLRGTPPRAVEDIVAARRAVTADDVREAFARAVGSLHLLVPGGVRPDAQLPEQPVQDVPPVTGRVLKRRLLSSAPLRSTATVSDDGITQYVPPDTLTVRFADAVAVERHPDGYVRLVGRDGIHLPLDERDWKDGASVLALLREKVPAALWYDLDPELEEQRG